MKRILLIAIAIMATGAMTDTSAQVFKRTKDGNKHWTDLPKPHKSINPTRQRPPAVSYDAASTVLMVKFPSNNNGSTVEVFRNGAKVAGITANAGTTFSCVLREYGVGNYNVIVSNGNTVIDAKKYTVR